MNEPKAMGCDELADVAAELALGVLTGRERAGALAHLDRCEACREKVRQLTMTGEDLLALLPASEPPPGFETRVMDRLGLTVPAPDPSQRARGRTGRARRLAGQRGKTVSRRRVMTVAAVALAAAMAVLGGWGLRAVTSSPARSPLSSATLISQTRHATGEIYVYSGTPGWLYMYVDRVSGSGIVICQLVSTGGHVATVGSFRLRDGSGAWGSREPAGAGTPAAARLITPGGTVLATATFSGR